MDIVVDDQGETLAPAWGERSQSGAFDPSRIVQLGSWMTILGTVRLLCALGDYSRAFLEQVRPGLPLLRTIAYFAQRNSPALVLGMAWPLILALLVRRTSNRTIVRAAAATFLILGLEGIVTFVSGVMFKPDNDVLVGSFAVSRWGLLAHQPATLLRALIGLVQLALEGATAVLAWKASAAIPVDATNLPGAGRRHLRGRLAVYLTLAFLVLNTRHAAWSAYVTVLNQSPPFRQFVLENDTPRRAVGPARVSRSELQPWVRAELDFDRANSLVLAGQYEQARDRFIEAIGDLEGREADSARVVQARGFNNLAWLLATCEDAGFIRPADALLYARRAVALADGEGTYWNTLGVAAYRARDWDEAEKALRRSMALRNEGRGDAFDWYFLAMLHARRGQKDEALSWYRKGAEWAGRNGQDRELFRFQVEAAGLLGLERPATPDRRSGRGEGAVGLFPRGLNRRQPTLGPRALVD